MTSLSLQQRSGPFADPATYPLQDSSNGVGPKRLLMVTNLIRDDKLIHVVIILNVRVVFFDPELDVGAHKK